MAESRGTVELSDARALRAVAHPVRLALVGLLRREGPLTATRAGALLGESATTCSFHLRQLARYGLVEEAGGGRGRERPWRATASFTSWPSVAENPEAQVAADALTAVVARRYFERLMRWLEHRSEDAREWREAPLFGDTIIVATAQELVELGRQLDELLEPYRRRLAEQREAWPPGARHVMVVKLAFPADDDLPRET